MHTQQVPHDQYYKNRSRNRNASTVERGNTKPGQRCGGTLPCYPYENCTERQRAVRAQGRADSGSTPNFQTTTTNKVQTIPKTAKKIATSPSEGGAGCGVVVETAVTGTPS